jgi:hypothetical protein
MKKQIFITIILIAAYTYVVGKPLSESETVHMDNTVVSYQNNNTSTHQQSKYNYFKTYTHYGSKAFSISYPDTWEKEDLPKKNFEGIMFTSPENAGENFRTNFNVIVSYNDSSLGSNFNDTQKLSKQYFLNYTLQKKEYITIDGIDGIKIESTYTLNGITLKLINYILKKKNYTTYSITFTCANQYYNRESTLINKIIQSFTTN